MAHRDVDARLIFLASYRRTGNVQLSAKQARVTRQAFYDWRDHEPDFKREFELAHEDYCDSIERVVHTIATKAKTPSLQACERILRAKRPSVWGDKARIEHTGAGGGPIRTAAQKLTAVEEAEIATMLGELGELGGMVSRNGHAEARQGAASC